MNTTFFKFSALALALGLCQTASAVVPIPTNLGALSFGSYLYNGNFVPVNITPFTQAFSFTLPTSKLIITAGANNHLYAPSLSSNIDSLHYDLFNSSNTLLSSYSNLSAGSYSLVFTGVSNGQIDGSYSFNLAVSAVPEAEQWAMMLVGLTLVSLQTLKTKKASARIGLSA